MALFNNHHYQKNSYIYIEGEKKAESFYIIKNGKVDITKRFPVANEKSHEILGSGDFFGVIGAMSQLPQLESAVALTDVEAISIHHNRFAELVQRNPALAKKILKSFSLRLRRFTETEDTILNFSLDYDYLKNMYESAEIYTGLNRKRIASYMYKCIIFYQPETKLARKSEERLQELEANGEFNKKTGIIREYDDGEIIFCENEPADEIFILKRGKIRISKLIDKKESQLYIMQPGDIFGEMSLLEDKPRSATAIALEDSEILVINRENYENMTQKEPRLMTKIISLVAERIWNRNKLILNSKFPDLNSKILDILLTVYEMSKSNSSHYEDYNFNLNFSDIMNMINTDERIDKVESTFLLQNKFIKIDKNSLICTDMQNLVRQVSALRTKYFANKIIR